MHDPMTVAHEIYLGSKKRKNGNYRTPIITIWHVDPETDGTDDSCGWFIRGRHLDKKLIDEVAKEFEYEWDRTHIGDNGYVYNCGWFSPEGDNVLSVMGIMLNMYIYAAKILLNKGGKIGPGKMWDKAYSFVKKHYVEIMYFSENNRDSMRDSIVRKFQRGCNEEYTPKKRMEMIQEFARTISSDIIRRNRKWYQHPRWHIHHWKIQFHPFQQLKRRYWDKCCMCGKRGFKGSANGDWSGTKIWHPECDKSSPLVCHTSE
jgi:hypothetical protein